MNKIRNLEFIRKGTIKSGSYTTLKTNSHILFYLSKRIFDVVISLLVTVFLLSWLVPILAILIKLDSKGSVFFLQKRVGASGKTFYCIKLRTMVKNAMANVQQAGANDPRITRVGKFLRFSYLDELPQFINVLKGDMSIVGPRPHMINDCLSFLEVVPNYYLRHQVKPGITGIAQVKGYRGKVTCYWDVIHRFKLDMFYVQKACFFFDLKIILQTFLQIVSSLDKLYKKESAAMELTVPAPTPVTTKTSRPLIKKVVAPMYEQMVGSERQSA